MIMQRCLYMPFLVVLCSTAPLLAQDKTGLNLDISATGQPGGVAQHDMAQGLFALGRTQKDTLLVLTAAKLVAGVQMTDVARDGVRTPADPAPDGTTLPPDAAMMLDAARGFADEDDTLLGLIEVVESQGAQGQISGAERELSALPPGAQDVWTVPFYGGSLAEIGVQGNGDTPLIVAITDENDNRIICPARVDDRFYCDFVPRWNGYFRISVSNTGGLVNSYYLLTN